MARHRRPARAPLLLPLSLLLASLLILSTCFDCARARPQDADRRHDVVRALKAIRGHPKVIKAAGPVRAFIDSVVYFFLREEGEGTLLLPLDFFYFWNTISTLTYDQVTIIKQLHILSGLYTYRDLRNFPRRSQLYTYVPDQNVTKFFGPLNPLVVFRAKGGGLPTQIVVPNLYIGATLNVHLITFALHPVL